MRMMIWITAASAVLVGGCSRHDDASADGGGSEDSVGDGSGDDGSADDGADGGLEGGGMACHEYGPGEAGGPDFTPWIDEATLAAIDFQISWPDAPIAAIDASAAYLADDGVLRVTFAGLVQIDHEHPSTLTSFNDIPLSGLGADNFALTSDGVPIASPSVACTGNARTPITVVFAIDVTGSMSPAIGAVRDSLVDFVDTATALGLAGKVGVVTYQDTVGVNIGFEDCSGIVGPIPERSPFFAPVALDDAPGVQQLRDFIAALHADQGSDLPENLAAAIDFATNNVIGYTDGGAPNVIGEGLDDPPWTSPWPVSELEGVVAVIAITDANFHQADSASPYLLPPWRPRALTEIVGDLDGAIVSTIDPAFLDGDRELDEFGDEVDADFWPTYSGGFGIDRWKVSTFLFEESVSLFDLELLVLGGGLLEIPLAPALAATCVLEAPLAHAPAEVHVDITHEAGAIGYTLAPPVISIE
jgi:hypothetical protein